MIHILIYIIFFLQDFIKSVPNKLQILQTPILKNSPKFLFLHNIVMFHENNVDVPKTDYKNVFLVDFSPNIPIDNIPNLCKILSGQKVPGKLRVYYFETMNLNCFLENSDIFIENKKNRIEISNESKLSIKSQYLLSCYQKKIDMTSEKAKELKIIFDCFDIWDLDFQLYNHNCQHFGKYFVRRANNFMD